MTINCAIYQKLYLNIFQIRFLHFIKVFISQWLAGFLCDLKEIFQWLFSVSEKVLVFEFSPKEHNFVWMPWLNQGWFSLTDREVMAIYQVIYALS